MRFRWLFIVIAVYGAVILASWLSSGWGWQAEVARMLQRSPRPQQPWNGHTFVRVEGGTFALGAPDHESNPARTVRVASFWIAAAETSNAEFARFVEATGYRTIAERGLGGMVPTTTDEGPSWQRNLSASWRRPWGADGPEAQPDEPVTQICFMDALAYCGWSGTRLPSVSEWEAAARSGAGGPFPWGAVRRPAGAAVANLAEPDPYDRLAPVISFPPTSRGLYHIVGNVFEFCVEDREAFVGTFSVPGRAVRGGAWTSGWADRVEMADLIEVGRAFETASACNHGFRVARDEMSESQPR